MCKKWSYSEGYQELYSSYSTDEDLPSTPDVEELEVRKTCFNCYPKKTQTTYVCLICNEPICIE